MIFHCKNIDPDNCTHFQISKIENKTIFFHEDIQKTTRDQLKSHSSFELILEAIDTIMKHLSHQLQFEGTLASKNKELELFLPELNCCLKFQIHIINTNYSKKPIVSSVLIKEISAIETQKEILCQAQNNHLNYSIKWAK